MSCRHDPQTVVLEAMERVRRSGLPIRSELLQESYEFRFSFLVRDPRRSSRLKSSEGVEQEQRLLRRPPPAAGPDLDLSNPLEPVVRRGHSGEPNGGRPRPLSVTSALPARGLRRNGGPLPGIL